MMKKITLLCILMAVSFGYSQTLPLDFETPTTWLDFGGGVVTTIANPQSNADNNSANVAQMVKFADQVYGGSSVVLSAPLDFTTNNTFTLKVYSIKAGTKVLLKVENSGNGAINYEKSATMTTTNAWETLTFDYSGIPANTYDKLTMIFDLGTLGDGSANFTYYFDDITLFDNGGTATEVLLPFDFSSPEQLMIGDNCTTSLTTDAGNDVLQVVGGGQFYDNAQIVFTQNIDLSNTANNTITFRVKAVAPLTSGSHLFKFESAVSGDAAVEVPFTTSGTDWQTISLDFDDAAGDNPGIYSKMVIFTDFANDEAGTYLFDDISLGNGLSVNDFENSGLKVYPNPSQNQWIVQSVAIISSIEVYDVLGKQVMDLSPNSKEISIQTSGLQAGYYFAKIKSATGSKTIKLIKQ